MSNRIERDKNTKDQTNKNKQTQQRKRLKHIVQDQEGNFL